MTTLPATDDLLRDLTLELQHAQAAHRDLPDGLTVCLLRYEGRRVVKLTQHHRPKSIAEWDRWHSAVESAVAKLGIGGWTRLARVGGANVASAWYEELL